MKNIIFCDHTSYKETAALAKKYAVGIECQAFYDPCMVERYPNYKEEYVKELDGIEIRSIHAPFWDMAPGSFDEKIRRVTKERFNAAYNQAISIGAKHMVIHFGDFPTGVFTSMTSLSAWQERSIEFFKDFFFDKNGEVTIYCENFLESNPEVLLHIVKSVNHTNFRINLDIGHVNYASEISIYRWIDTLKDYIGYIHIHNNFGEKDSHLPLFEGDLNIKDVLQYLSTHCPYAIYAIENSQADLVKSILWLCDNGYLQ